MVPNGNSHVIVNEILELSSASCTLVLCSVYSYDFRKIVLNTIKVLVYGDCNCTLM